MLPELRFWKLRSNVCLTPNSGRAVSPLGALGAGDFYVEVLAGLRTGEGTHQAEEVIRSAAAELALHAIEWNERFSRIVGWEPMVFDRGRIRALKRIVDEDRTKHERNEKKDGGSGSGA